MRILLFILLMITGGFSFTQMSIEKTSHDFGNLYANAQTYVDFEFKNIGQSKAYLLTIDKPREVYYIYSSKLIQADSTVTVRLKINDNIKGKFNYKVDVHFSNSNKPVTLTLTGNIKERSDNPLTACPDFTAAPPKDGLAHFEVTIKVVDSLTQEPLRRSRVYLINNGTMVGAYYTNANGIIHKSVPLGLYYITAEKSPYKSNFHEGYLNFQDNYVKIELQKEKIDDPVIEEPDRIVIVPDIEEQEEEEPEVDESEEDDTIIVIEEEETTEEMEETVEEVVVEEIEEELVEIEETPVDSSDFNSSLFVPNNIVFIVDVSSSMNQMGKMDLLKYAMIELTKILRTQDKVSLIAYSGSVRTLFEFESGANKDEIITKVKTLKSGGYTDGGMAIKEGVKLAKKGYIEGGNNLIFMVTDGAFNKGSKDYMRTIEYTHKTKDIKFSVVGVKTSDYLTGHMTKIAAKGGGEYVRIITVDDAQNKLFEEVKRTSIKN